MTDRTAIWVAMLRPYDGHIMVEGVMSLREMADTAHQLELKMRYNPIRLFTMRLPAGTQREQVFGALESLSNDERLRLYNLPQHHTVG